MDPRRLRSPDSAPQRRSLGVPGLDELLNGGVRPESSLVVTGPSGSGKTWFAVQYLLASVERGAKALYLHIGATTARLPATLPFEQRLRDLASEGRFALRVEELNRSVAPWLTRWLEEQSGECVVVLELGVELRDLSVRQCSWIAEAQNELSRNGTALLLTCRTANAQPDQLARVTQIAPSADGTIVLELRTTEWGLERFLLIAMLKGEVVSSRYHALEIREGRLRIAADTPPRSESDEDPKADVLYIGAPSFLQGAQRRLYTQRLRRQLNTNQEHGTMRSIQSRPLFSQLLSELYAPSTDFGAVLVSSPGVIRHLAEQDLLMPLEDVFPEHNELFLEKAVLRSAFSGHLFAIPQYVSMRVLYYRADLLQKHGLLPPRTWDELEAQASFILRAERDPKLNGFQFEFRPAVRFGVLLDHVWSSGLDLYEQSTNWSFARGAVRDALARLRRMVEQSGVSAPRPTPSEHWEAFQDFFAGRTLFLHHWSDGIRLIHEKGQQARERFNWCPLPTSAPGVDGRALTAGVSYVVPKNTRHPEAARRAIQSMLEPAFLAKMEVDFGWPFPAALSLYDDPKVLAAHPYYARGHALLEHGRLLEEARYIQGAPFEWGRVAGEVLSGAFANSERERAPDIEEVLERLEASFSELLPKPAYSGLTARAAALLERELEQPFSGETLAKKLGVSRPHLLTTFKRETGTTLHDYATTLRISRAKELLHNTNLSIGEIGTRLGYKTIFHFSRVFKTSTSLSPREYRSKR